MPEPLLDRTRPDFIPVCRPSITAREISNVVESLRACQVSQGPRVREFESRFAESHGCSFGISCNSGTSAIQIAIEALGLRGKTIAMPSLAMIACANAILDAGCRPVFIDSLLATGNIDLGQLRGAETIDAILVIHLYGVAVDFHQADWDVPILEDCCESHFANHENGDKVGSRGAAACFSFYANKVLQTAEGGMVCTNFPDVASRAALLRAHAFTTAEHFHHTEQAHGMRMTEMQGAIGCAQLDRAPHMLLHRAKLMALYSKLLAGLDWLDFQYRPIGSANWIFPALISPRWLTRLPLAHVRQQIADAGIETRPWFKPMHLQPHLKQFVLPGQEFPVSESLWQRGFYLPLYMDLTEADVERICQVLRAIQPFGCSLRSAA